MLRHIREFSTVYEREIWIHGSENVETIKENYELKGLNADYVWLIFTLINPFPD